MTKSTSIQSEPTDLTVPQDQSMLEAIVETTPCSLMVIDPDYRVIMANEKIRKFCGHEDPVKDGMKCHELLFGHSEPCIGGDHVCPLLEITKSAEPMQTEHTHINSKGEKRIDKVSAFPVLDENGRVLRVFLAMQDVTVKRTQEKEIHRRDRFMSALNEAVHITMQSKESIPYQAFVKAIGPVSNASRAYVFLNHYDHEGELMMSMVGEWCADGIDSHIGNSDFQSAHYDSLCPQWKKPLSLGKAIRGEVDTFSNQERKMLESRGAHSILILPLMIDSTFAGFIGFDDCASDREWLPSERSFFRAAANLLSQSIMRKRTEVQRLQLEQQIQHTQKMDSLGVMAGGIAHDFNNLLVSILGNADLALLDIKEDHPAYECVTEIEHGARRAADLTRQMLAYAGGGRFLPESVDLSTIVRKIDHLIESSLPKSVTLRINLKDDLPAVEADASQLQHILLNLARNSSEAVQDQDNGIIEITTGIRECDRRCLDEEMIDTRKEGTPLPEGEYVYFSVADNGCGMDDETMSRIFDPFFSTKFQGRGLGMAALMGIVRTHNGTINLLSKPNKGTVFTILFPAIKESAIIEEPVDDENTVDWQGSGTILIVDDDTSVRNVASRVLKRKGFSILIAEDGMVGVEMFEKHADDIRCVLLDLAMPRMGGEEAFYKIREIREDATVILSSGYGEKDVAQPFKEAGLNGFLQKPYRSAELISKLRNVLSN